jgi:hypothetical protein
MAFRFFHDAATRSTEIGVAPVFSAKTSAFSLFCLLLMPLLSLIDIRDADHPGQSALPLGDHTEFADLKFPAPECLLMVQVCLAPGWNAGVPGCNGPPIP